MSDRFNFYLDGIKVNEIPLETTEFTFTGLRSGTPHLITATQVDLAGRESELSVPLNVSTSEYIPVEGEMSPVDEAHIDSVVAAAMADGMGPGVSISIDGPKGSYHKAFGSAGSRDLTLDDHFRIASATKAFTATAVMMAIDEGLLSFEDTLNQFDTLNYTLSAVPNSNKITVRHMLMMRSGIYDYQTNIGVIIMYFLNPGTYFPDANKLQHIAGNAGYFEPGTDFYYTNGNHVLLGLILESLYGKPIQEILKEKIIDPLGLTETSWPTGTAMPEPYAHGYGGPLGPNWDATNMNTPSLFGAAGALISTVGDLQVWAKAMRDGTLLSPEMHSLWENTFCNLPFPNDFGAQTVGYGMGTYAYGDWRGHPGSGPGYECLAMYNVTDGSTIVFMENSQNPTNGVAAATFTRLIPEIAGYLWPESIYDSPSDACVLPEDPFIGAPNPGNIGYDSVSVPIYGLGSASGNFKAELGADVFVAVSWDRTSATPTVKYNDQVMNFLGRQNNNNTAAKGGQGLYHLAGAGTGEEETIHISGGNGWQSAFGISFNNVASVDSPTFNHGLSKEHTHDVTISDGVDTKGLVLQVFSAANGGGPYQNLASITGARQRARLVGVSPLVCVSTTIHSGTILGMGLGANSWGSIAVHMEIDQ